MTHDTSLQYFLLLSKEKWRKTDEELVHQVSHVPFLTGSACRKWPPYNTNCCEREFLFLLITLQDGLNCVRFMTYSSIECFTSLNILEIFLLLTELFLVILPWKRLQFAQGRRKHSTPSKYLLQFEYMAHLTFTNIPFPKRILKRYIPQEGLHYSFQKAHFFFSNVSTLQISRSPRVVLPGKQNHGIVPQPFKCMETSAQQRAVADTKGAQLGLQIEASLWTVVFMSYFKLGFPPLTAMGPRGALAPCCSCPSLLKCWLCRSCPGLGQSAVGGQEQTYLHLHSSGQSVQLQILST